MSNEIAATAVRQDRPDRSLPAPDRLPMVARLAIYGVLFTIYSNAAVVAVKFHGMPKWLGMASAVPLLLPLAWCVYRHRAVRLTPTMPWIAAFFFAQLVSGLLSHNPGASVKAVVTDVAEGLVLYALLVNVLVSPRLVRGAVFTLIVTGALVGGLSLFQKATGTYGRDYGGFAQVSDGEGFRIAPERGDVRQRRLCGPIGEQNRYGQIMLILVPLGLAAAVSARSRAMRVFALGAVCLIAIGTALTYSRGAAVAGVMLLPALAAARLITVRHLGVLVVLAVVVIVAAPEYRVRLESMLSPMGLADPQPDEEGLDGAVRGRATAMLAAARVCAAYPVWGVGKGMFNEYSRQYGMEGGLRALEGTREAHNLYLDIAAEHGLVGLTMFAGMILVSWLNLRRVARRPDLPHLDSSLVTGLSLALLAYLATGMFLHFSYTRYFWLLLAVADSAVIVFANVRCQPSTARDPEGSAGAAT